MGKNVSHVAGLLIACVLAAGAAVAQYAELPTFVQAALAALAAIAGVLGFQVRAPARRDDPPGVKHV